MSRSGSTLWRVIKALLWFLLRLVVLAFTGTWLSSGDERNASDESDEADASGRDQPGATDPLAAPSRDVPVGGVTAPQVTERAPQDAATSHVELLARARILRGRVQRERLGEHLDAALGALMAELGSRGPGRPPSGGEEEGDRPLEHSAQALRYLERAVSSRRRDRYQRDWHAALDRMAEDLLSPVVGLLEAHGAAGQRRHWVSVPGQLRESLHRALLETSVGGLAIERDLDRQPQHWPKLAPRVARTLLLDVPGLADELYHRHRLPAVLPLPHSHVGYGPDDVHGAMGVWLETLFADVYATLRLGPAYSRFLIDSFADKQPARRLYAATAHGTFLAPIPPPALRMVVSLRALEVLGHLEAQDDLWEQWQQRHGEVEVFYFPTADGIWKAIPAGYVLAQLDPLFESLTTEPLQSLHEQAWTDLVDLEFGHADAASARRLRRLFERGEGEAHAPYVVLAAAAQAVAVDHVDPERVSAAALRLLGVDERPALEGVRGAGAASRLSSGGGRVVTPRTLAAAVRSPRLLREAIALSAALGREGPRGRADRWPVRRIR